MRRQRIDDTMRNVSGGGVGMMDRVRDLIDP
jgi:hypothetical protein